MNALTGAAYVRQLETTNQRLVDENTRLIIAVCKAGALLREWSDAKEEGPTIDWLRENDEWRR